MEGNSEKIITLKIELGSPIILTAHATYSTARRVAP